MFSFLLTFLYFVLSCEGNKNYNSINNADNVSIDKLSNIPGKFFPSQILMDSSFIYFSGSTSMSHDNNEIFYKLSIGDSLANEIHKLRCATTVDMIKVSDGILISGRYFEESGINGPLNFLAKVTDNKFKQGQLSENLTYTLCSQGNLLIKVADYKSKIQILVSNDLGDNWSEITALEKFIDFDYKNTSIYDDKLITYGTMKGFKPEDYSIIIYDLKTQLLKTIPIKNLGSFEGIKIIDKKPFLLTSESDVFTLYDLTKDSPEKTSSIKSPANEWKIADIMVFEQTEIIVTVNNQIFQDRYRVYSRKNKVGWQLDFSSPLFDVYTFYENKLAGFDIDQNLVTITY